MRRFTWWYQYHVLLVAAPLPGGHQVPMPPRWAWVSTELILCLARCCHWAVCPEQAGKGSGLLGQPLLLCAGCWQQCMEHLWSAPVSSMPQRLQQVHDAASSTATAAFLFPFPAAHTVGVTWWHVSVGFLQKVLLWMNLFNRRSSVVTRYLVILTPFVLCCQFF